MNKKRNLTVDFYECSHLESELFGTCREMQKNADVYAVRNSCENFFNVNSFHVMKMIKLVS